MSRAVLTLLLALAVAGGASASGADFTASSSSTSSFTTAADFNTVAVNLDSVGTPLIGPVSLTATASSNRGIASVVMQAAPTGTSDWVTICTVNVGPYTCSWDTPAIADDKYDVRATATDSAGYSKTSTVTGRVVDNYTLSVTLSDPGAMSGSESLTATAANAGGGGLQSLKIQHRAPGAASWTDVCSGATTPQSCSLDTTALPAGSRELRAVVTDLSGHTAQSQLITRTIDNSPPTNTPSIPPTGTGTISMGADAQDDGSGIAYVAFEGLYAGVWYEFCRDTSAPYACVGDSNVVADGTYSIRVVVVNNAGVKTTSAPTSITIDNPPRGTDVQAGNVTAGTPGLLESGDWIRLTWTEPIAPASVLSAWTGAAQPIRVRITDATTNDQMDFLDAGGSRLNLVSSAVDLKLGGNYVTSTTDFNATMTQSGNSITITLGTIISGAPATVATATTMTWRPSAAAKDATNHASSTALVTEPGTADVDF